MKWNEFKQQVESAGVTDDSDISWITVITDKDGNANFTVEKTPYGEWEIDDKDD